MKLSRYHRTALFALFAQEDERLRKNNQWIKKEPKNSPNVDWKGHRQNVAQVSALRKVLAESKPAEDGCADEQRIHLKAKAAVGSPHNLRRLRTLEVRRAAAALASTGLSVRTVYFPGRHTEEASDYGPDAVVILLPVQLLRIPSSRAVAGDSFRKAKAKVKNFKSQTEASQ